jgi:hypothetical protein
MVRLCGVKALLLDEFGIQKDQTLIHNLKRTGHSLIVLTELSNYLLSTLAR